MIIPTAESYTNLNNLLGRTPVYRATIVKGPPQPQPAFTYHWPLDEASGTRHSSYSPGNADYAFTDNGTVGSTTGKHSNCATFNGSSQYLSLVATNLGIGDATIFIRGWVYLTSKAADAIIIGQYGTTGSRSWRFWYDQSADRFVFDIHNGASTESVSADSFGAPAINTWYEFRAWRMVSPSGYLYIQINTETALGTIDNADGSAIYPEYVTSEDIRIGAQRADGATIDGYLPGRVDEVTLALYHIPSGTEQAILYNGGTGGSLPVPADLYTTYVFDTAHDSTGEPATAVSALHPIELQKQVDIPYSRFPLSILTFYLKNLPSAEALFIAGAKGAACTFTAAFWELPTEYATLFTGYISDVQVQEGRFMVIATSKIAVALQSLIFAGGQSQLSTDINSNVTVWPIMDESSFTSQAEGTSFAVCDQEVCFYGGTQPGWLLNVDRNPANPKVIPPLIPDGMAAAHSQGAQVRELVYLGFLHNGNAEGGTNDLHPVNHIRTVVTGITPQNVMATSKQSIGFPNRLAVNETELTALRTALGEATQMLFMDDEAIPAKDFMEKELYFPPGIYPTENAAGEIGGKTYPVESEFSALDTIDDSHVLAVPQRMPDAETRINQVIYYYDYMPTTKQYLTKTMFVDDAAVAQHGTELPLVIYSKGIRSPYDEADLGIGTRKWFQNTPTFLAESARRHLSRFGSRASVLRCETILRDNLLEPSDDVTGTFTNVIDEVNGQVNINRPFDVISERIDFEANKIEFQLMEHTAYQSAPRLVTT